MISLGPNFLVSEMDLPALVPNCAYRVTVRNRWDIEYRAAGIGSDMIGARQMLVQMSFR